MPNRRRPKADKLAAVLAADMTGVVAASEATGIPESTIRYWMEKPEFAAYRAKAREDLKDEITVVAHLAWQRVAEGLASGAMEPRDALFAAEKATTQYLLMSGEATGRLEHKTLTEGLDDHERAALRDIIDAALQAAPAAPEGAAG